MNTTDTAATRTRPYPSTIQPGFYESSNLPPTQNHNRVLFRVKAVWPFDWYPDELVIQEKTVSAVKREFMLKYVETMPIKDIGEVVVIETLFLASVTLASTSPVYQLKIKCLRKSDA